MKSGSLVKSGSREKSGSLAKSGSPEVRKSGSRLKASPAVRGVKKGKAHHPIVKKSRPRRLPDFRTSGLPDGTTDGTTDGTNRLAQTFARLRETKQKAFIAYLCAGDPNLDATVDLVCAMANHRDPARRVDVVELGIPYSDPMADGLAIQASCERALASGTTLRGVLAAVKRIRERTQVPLVAFTYLSPVQAYGIQAFARDAVAAGIDAVLPLDLPPDEDPSVIEAFRQAGLANVCLAAPTTTPERKRFLARESRGFLYYVCRLGVTGERTTLPADLRKQVQALKQVSSAPVCIGFGISTPEQAAQAAQHGDGVIVGSHLVRLIEKGGRGSRAALVKAVANRAGELAAAVHAV
jgi:tryptophan synthase alpha chain